MVNFQYVNVLPESFFGLYLHGSGGPFLQAVAAKIGFPVSSQLDLLSSAAVIVVQSGNSSLGEYQGL
jgi:hypothetical protein